MDRYGKATPQDRIEVGGLSALLHPDSQSGPLELTLRCNGNSYTATIRDAVAGWVLILEDMQSGQRRRELGTSQDATIVTALLRSLDATWLQASTVD